MSLAFGNGTSWCLAAASIGEEWLVGCAGSDNMLEGVADHPDGILGAIVTVLLLVFDISSKFSESFFHRIMPRCRKAAAKPTSSSG